MIDATSSYNLTEELCKSVKSLSLSSASTEGLPSTVIGTSVSIALATVINKYEYLCIAIMKIVN